MENKKVYPSELATKSVACRVPASVYVDILNDAIQKGININDWLLRKIFSDNVIGKTEKNNDVFLSPEDLELDNSFDDRKHVAESKKQFLKIIELYGDNKSNFLRLMFHWYMNQNYLESVIDELNEKLENNHKVADINDVINQVTILVQQTDWSQKEKSEFRSEILPLLKELKS
jgi:hypothetical protein